MATAPDTSQRGTPKQARGIAARNALLDATAEILAEATQIEVSLSEISRRSKINSAMIKYYFGDKQGLLMALLERDAELAMSSLNALVAMDISAEKKMTIHVEGMVNAYYRAPYLNRLLHYIVEAGGSEASARMSRLFIHPMMNAYRSIIRQGVAEGSMAEIEPGMLYYALVGSADHPFYANYSAPAVLGTEAIDVETKNGYATFLRQIFIKGLRP
ncbi:hypothetical protein DM806_11390 [Sphingobium lactosutens]|uniref:TetR family transcriptional regulator n=1 Tax=Sphingobium lactosutens TaxID=522773 RepID=UPI0015B97ABD|nr:TetR family transcriptional regulator [Sphingobium lactosutens]NWK96255.1 hypothetical protein [Sphingobium lactosutens]